VAPDHQRKLHIWGTDKEVFFVVFQLECDAPNVKIDLTFESQSTGWPMIVPLCLTTAESGWNKAPIGINSNLLNQFSKLKIGGGSHSYEVSKVYYHVNERGVISQVRLLSVGNNPRTASLITTDNSSMPVSVNLDNIDILRTLRFNRPHSHRARLPRPVGDELGMALGWVWAGGNSE
jgi:hypothetical protein